MNTLRRLHWTETLILLGLMVLALALRLWHLGEQSLWLDEAATFAMSAGSFGDVLRTALDHPLDFPLERFLLNPLTRYPPDEFLFRLPAALWGVLGAALTYLLARQVWDRETALLAAGLLALSPYNIRYSQEARNYTSFLALHLLTLIMLMRAVRRPTGAAWALYALAAGITIYDHLYSFIVLAWQWGLHALLVLLSAWRGGQISGVSWRSLRAHLLALLGAGALFLPWALYLVSGSPVLQRMSTSNGLFRAPESIRFDADLFLRMLSWFTANAGNAAPAVWLALAGTVGALILPPARYRRLALLAIVYLAGAFLTVAVLSRISNTYLAYRRLLFLQPLLLILLAGGCTALIRRIWQWRTRRERPTGVLVPALLLLAAGLAWAPAVADHYVSQKENWRDAARVLRDEAGRQDWIVNCADSPNAWEALRVYLGPSAEQLHLLTPAQAVQRLSSPSRPPARVWYILPVPVEASPGRRWQFNDPAHLRQLDGDRSLPPHALMLSLERWDVPAGDRDFLERSLLDALQRSFSSQLPIPLDWRFNPLNAWVTYHDAQGDWAPSLRAYQEILDMPHIPPSIRENLESLARYMDWKMTHAGGIVPGAFWDTPALREAVQSYLQQNGMSAGSLDELLSATVTLAAEVSDELPAGALRWRFERPEDLAGWDVRLAGAAAELETGECGGEYGGCLRIDAAGAGYHGSLTRTLHLEPGRLYLLRCTMRARSALALQGKALYVSYRQGWRRPGAYASAFWGSSDWQTFAALFVPPAGVSEIALSPALMDHAGTLWIAEVAVIPLSP